MALYKEAQEIDAATNRLETADIPRAIKKNRSLFVEHLGEKMTSELERNSSEKVKGLPVPIRQLILELINQIG